VEYYAHVPNHRMWAAGQNVLGNKRIAPGTAIATFVKGRYMSSAHGNHAAFFLRQGAPGDGFWVIDQWDDASPNRGRKPFISARYIRSLHRKQNVDGTWPFASDNADAYSVIELK
jgi:hypothetical protein